VPEVSRQNIRNLIPVKVPLRALFHVRHKCGWSLILAIVSTSMHRRKSCFRVLKQERAVSRWQTGKSCFHLDAQKKELFSRSQTRKSCFALANRKELFPPRCTEERAVFGFETRKSESFSSETCSKMHETEHKVNKIIN
jgi:hypothetical protein